MRLFPLYLTVGLGLLAACADEETPTQPGAGTAAQPSAAVTEAAASNTWTLKAAPPDFAFANEATYGVMPDASGNPVVYQLGGRDNDGGSGAIVLEYRVATNVWSARGNYPQIYSFNTNGVARIGNLLYVSGGESYGGGTFDIDGTFWAYNPATNTLTQKPDPPKLTAEGVSGVIDGKLYVLPAVCDTYNFPHPEFCENEPFRRLFRYNPATNKWATKKSAPHVHTTGAGGVINGKFYVAGGYHTNTLDRYDPANDTWQTLASLPVGGTARGAVMQGKLWVVVSHFFEDKGKSVLYAYAYNPATNTWARKAAPKYAHPDMVAITWKGKPYLLALGGLGGIGDDTPLPTELYTP